MKVRYVCGGAKKGGGCLNRDGWLDFGAESREENECFAKLILQREFGHEICNRKNI